MKKKKLIIFGGSFDPIHKGHIKIASRAFNKIKADKLFFVPCNNHPDNKKISASNYDRLQMLRLSIKGYPRFEICEFEIKRNEISYTINTINYFKEFYSDYELYLLIGYDQWINFKSWHNYQKILNSVKLICYKRSIQEQTQPSNESTNNSDNNQIIQNNINQVEQVQINVENEKLEINNNLKTQQIDDIDNLDKTREINNISNLNTDKPIKYILIGNLFQINISSSKIRTNPKKRHLNHDVLNYINANGLYAVNRLEQVMSDYRLQHSIRVAEIALDITKSLKYYPLLKQAYVAAIYHDYAKEFSEKYQTSVWTLFKIGYLFKYKKLYNQKKIENKHTSLWKVIHAWLGAYLIKKRFYINDYQVLNAIKNHSILETQDNILAKIIYCADKLDIRKDGEIHDRKKLYELCKKDINKGYIEIFNRLNKGNN